MGGSSSKPPSPPPRPLTDTPWRYLSKSGADLERSIIEDIQRLHPEKKPGILIVGPVGAGKSSFINSCLSIGVGRKKALAQTGSAEASYTTEFRSYRDSELLKNYRVRDCMGIEPKYGKGFHPNDIFALLEGHIKKNYKFDQDKPIDSSSEYWKANPDFEDMTHCVVFVISAKTMYDGIPQEYIDKIKWLQQKIKAADVPRVLLLPKADELCEEVKRNTSNIFRSVKVQRAVDFASEVFSIEKASIHPLVNYEEGYELTTEQNIPVLLALRQILQFASDRVEYVLDSD